MNAPEEQLIIAEQPAEAAEQHQSHFAKWARRAAVVAGLSGGIVGGAYAAFSPTEIPLGPHDATFQLSLQPDQNFDLGPLGHIRKATKWPIGFDVRVGEIPDQAGQTPQSALGSLITGYKTSFAYADRLIAEDKHIVEKRVEHDALAGGLLGSVGSLALLGYGRLSYRRLDEKRRNHLVTAAQELAHGLTAEPNGSRPRRLIVASGLAIAIALPGCAASEQLPASQHPIAVDHVLDGSPLQGYEVSGTYLQVGINLLVPMIEKYKHQNDVFYGQAKLSVATSFQKLIDRTPLDHTRFDFLMNVSDNHCNLGMDPVHGEIAKLFGADMVIDSGDMVFSGTSGEDICVASEAANLKGPHRSLVFVPGNHDSPLTAQQARDHGFVVIDTPGVKTVKGYRILGAADVNESVLGVPIHLRGTMDIASETSLLTSLADQTRPDLLVVHEPEMAMPAVSQGLVPLSISGHTHILNGPNLLNGATDSYQFTEGTSGGAEEDTPTIGVLHRVATDTVFVFDKTTKRAVGYYVVTIDTAAQAHISDFVSMMSLRSAETSAVIAAPKSATIIKP